MYIFIFIVTLFLKLQPNIIQKVLKLKETMQIFENVRSQLQLLEDDGEVKSIMRIEVGETNLKKPVI